MSLKYGLNVKKAGPAPVRKTILDDEDDEEDDAPSTTNNNTTTQEEEITSFTTNSTKKPFLPSAPRPRKQLPSDSNLPPITSDLSTASVSRTQISTAQDLDPTIFDYDTYHSAKTATTNLRQQAAKADAHARKPKYVANLLESAARRKQDQLIAKEKALQREREKEGDEFAGTEKFVTGAYREVQEEARRLEGEEERRRAEEEERRKKGGGGMGGFYRGLMEERERAHQEEIEGVEGRLGQAGADGDEDGVEERSERDIAAEAQARGKNVHVNDEGQITDKRSLLSAGLNIGSSSSGNKSAHAADHLRTSARAAQPNAFAKKDMGGKQAQRERQSRMLEEQLAERAKRAREEEEEERVKLERAAKTTKTEKDVGDARARFLARKAAKEKEKAGG